MIQSLGIRTITVRSELKVEHIGQVMSTDLPVQEPGQLVYLQQSLNLPSRQVDLVEVEDVDPRSEWNLFE